MIDHVIRFRLTRPSRTGGEPTIGGLGVIWPDGTATLFLPYQGNAKVQLSGTPQVEDFAAREQLTIEANVTDLPPLPEHEPAGSLVGTEINPSQEALSEPNPATNRAARRKEARSNGKAPPVPAEVS